MKKRPSFGFIYLVFIVFVAIQFFNWIIHEGWYDKIHTLSQTDKDFEEWAHYLGYQACYLEQISGDFKDKSEQEKTLRKAGSLYLQIGDKRNACSIYRRLVELAPDNNIYLSQLTALIYMEAKHQAEVAENIRRLYKTGQENKFIDDNLLKVLSAQLFEGNEGIDKKEVLELIFSGEYSNLCTFFEGGNIALCNLTTDRWSTNMEPFFIAIKNPYNEQKDVKFEIGCWPDSRFVPVVAEIEGDGVRKKVVFDEKNKFHTVLLTVAPGQRSLFKGNTDKTWRAPKDPRRLGVNVRFLEVVKSETAEAAD